MAVPGKIVEAPAGLKGFDCNEHISPHRAAAFRVAGYRFCIRYVPRHARSASDLAASEASGILSNGLGLMIVQHVHPDSETTGWEPTAALGKQYGAFAAESAIEVGYKFGATIWCDLEGVKPGTDHRDVIAFCNNWLDQVGHAGFTPGLYVGFNCGLTPQELYSRLRFGLYWAAYNLNTDQHPATRDVCMKQDVEKVLSGIRFDPDTIKADALGGLPLMLVDNEWTAT